MGVSCLGTASQRDHTYQMRQSLDMSRHIPLKSQTKQQDFIRERYNSLDYNSHPSPARHGIQTWQMLHPCPSDRQRGQNLTNVTLAEQGFMSLLH